MTNNLSMKVADSCSNLRDLLRFVDFRVAPVVVHNISLWIVGNFDCGERSVIHADGQ
jgi:hypothetical protein